MKSNGKTPGEHGLPGYSHTPVLLKEAIDFLRIQNGQKYIDATLGGGGYSFEIVKRGGAVLAIDLDQDSVGYVKKAWEKESQILGIRKERLTLTQGNFSNIENLATESGFGKVAGIVFDLGLSGYQIERSGRGFSFVRDEPLDMRMNKNANMTAADIVNHWSKEELYELFSKMGEENFSLSITRNIISARKIKPILTSLQLADIVKRSVTERRKIHPATLVFQALRIAVNSELENIKLGIVNGVRLLLPEARIAVVSFHSLEDRIVKRLFQKFELENTGRMLTKKPVGPSPSEILTNRRSRSAKLRVFEKKII